MAATTEELNKTGESVPVEVAVAPPAVEEPVGEAMAMMTDSPKPPSAVKEGKVGKYGERKDSASWVYEHWEPVDETEQGPKQKYKCKYCKNAQYRHNVTRMRNHLLTCSLAPPEAKEAAHQRSASIEKRKSEKAKTKGRGDDGDKAEASSKKRKDVDAAAKGVFSEAKRISLDHLSLHKDFAGAINALKLGPEVVETDKLKTFIQRLCPEYNYPSLNEMNEAYKKLAGDEAYPEDGVNNTAAAAAAATMVVEQNHAT